MDKKSGNHKEGVSVQEIENFSKKFRFELFFTIVFVLAAVFAMIFSYADLSILLVGVGGVIGVWIPEKVAKFFGYLYSFVLKQELVIAIVISAVIALIAVVFPPLIFLLVGLRSGKSFHRKDIH